ncbi:MAG: hypothetical protein ACREA3_07220 [Nitrosotalea sp.]
MTANEELFEEIWVSSNYTTVFCTEEEKEHYLHSLSSKKMIPSRMSVVFIKRKLNRHYTKNEILCATPEQLRVMIE